MTDTAKKTTKAPAKKSASAKKAPASNVSPAKKATATAKKTSAPAKKATPSKASAKKPTSAPKPQAKKQATAPKLQAVATQAQEAAAKRVDVVTPTKTQRVEAKREARKVVPVVRDGLSRNAGELKATVTTALTPSEHKRGLLGVAIGAPWAIASKALAMSASSASTVAATATKPVRKLLPR